MCLYLMRISPHSVEIPIQCLRCLDRIGLRLSILMRLSMRIGVDFGRDLHSIKCLDIFWVCLTLLSYLLA